MVFFFVRLDDIRESLRRVLPVCSLATDSFLLGKRVGETLPAYIYIYIYYIYMYLYMHVSIYVYMAGGSCGQSTKQDYQKAA